MEKAKFCLAVVFFFLGISYLYWPQLILKINEFAKRYLFNDSYVLLNRRKWGLFFIILALAALLSRVH